MVTLAKIKFGVTLADEAAALIQGGFQGRGDAFDVLCPDTVCLDSVKVKGETLNIPKSTFLKGKTNVKC